jgi:hypothetical protein
MHHVMLFAEGRISSEEPFRVAFNAQVSQLNATFLITKIQECVLNYCPTWEGRNFCRRQHQHGIVPALRRLPRAPWCCLLRSRSLGLQVAAIGKRVVTLMPQRARHAVGVALCAEHLHRQWDGLHGTLQLQLDRHATRGSFHFVLDSERCGIMLSKREAVSILLATVFLTVRLHTQSFITGVKFHSPSPV